VNLKPHLEATTECLAVDRFGEPLTEAEQAHLRTCMRCEAELSLWQSFEDSEPAADDGAAVQWIVSELRRRRTPQPTPLLHRARRRWLASIGWRPLAGLAAFVLVVGTGYLMWDPEPRIGAPVPGVQTYRTSAVRVTGPIGEIASPPSELTWVAVGGAMRYDVQLLEIDQTLLWTASERSTRIELPRAVVDRIVPGKTLLWTVTAVDGSGRTIAESGMQSFRVAVAPGSGRR
jgi:hypothetical protein